MSHVKNAVIKQNLQFIYGRSHDNLPDLYPSEKNKNPRQVFDPDKAAILPTINAPITDLLADTDVISDFVKDFEALQPSYAIDVFLMGDNKPYPSFEHALQASKFTKTEIKDQIRNMKDIKELKRYVAKLKDQTDIFLEDWQWFCLTIGECLLRDKCIRHAAVKQALLATKHSKLVFKNEYNDTFWGYNPVKLVGNNHLGKLLEKIRTELQQGTIYRYWIHDHKRLYEPIDHLRIVVYSPKTKTELYSSYLSGGKDGVSSESIEEELKFLHESRFADDSKPATSRNEGDGNHGDPDEHIYDEKTIILIGQKNDQYHVNDLLLYHYTISRQHAAIVLDKEGHVYLVDFESRNKTFVNGVALAPYQFHKISDQDDFIQFGALGKLYHVQVHLNSQELKKQEIFDLILEDSNLGSSSKHGKGLSKEEEQENTVFVRNISYDCKEEDIQKFFAECGAILHLSFPIDKKTNQNKGIAFVTFKEYTGVLQALLRDGDELKGRYVQVKRSEARKSDLNAATKVKEEGKIFIKKESAFSNWGKPNSNSSSQADRNDRSDQTAHSSNYNPPRSTRNLNEREGRSKEREQRSFGARKEKGPRDPDLKQERDDGRRERDRRSADRNPRENRSRERHSSRDSGRNRKDGRNRSRDRSRDGKRSVKDRSSSPRKSRRHSSPSISPNRNRRTYSNSPPRRSSRSKSPIQRRDLPSPPRKPAHRKNSPTPSPPRRKGGRNHSPIQQRDSQSPPRRPGGRNKSPIQRRDSPSPPRKPAHRKKSPTPSPPRRKRNDTDVSHSPSPLRKRQKNSSSRSPSPPRKARSITPSPPRRNSSISPPKRKSPSNASPPRRSFTPSPPRRKKSDNYN